MERAREARRTIARAASRAPMLFQRFPHRPPVLRGRLHDDFLDVLLDQPVGQAARWRDAPRSSDDGRVALFLPFGAPRTGNARQSASQTEVRIGRSLLGEAHDPASSRNEAHAFCPSLAARMSRCCA
jgi:hypothetical protein